MDDLAQLAAEETDLHDAVCCDPDGFIATAPPLSDREPYVGDGSDGCLRSAQIDREEADTLDTDLHADRIVELLESAIRWEAQAVRAAIAEASAHDPAQAER